MNSKPRAWLPNHVSCEAERKATRWFYSPILCLGMSQCTEAKGKAVLGLFSEQEGLVFADKGRACPVWYLSPDDKDKAHPRERLVPGGIKWKHVPHLSSLLMSTPTEGGAARISVMSGRNLWRMSFRDVQPVCT